ncbi:MAG: hydroxypyruvate isomerase family protein [Armatimonadota bacterium]
MPKIGVCLEMVFTDLPYEKRIEEIAKTGFDTVEFWFHDATFDGSTCSMDGAKDAAALRQVCTANGVSISNMVVNAPDGSFGGAPVDAGDLGKYLERLHEVIAFSKEAGIGMAITCSGNLVPGLTRAEMRANLERAWGEAASIAEKAGYTLVVEPLNTHVDHAGYYLDSSAEGAEIVRAINSPDLRLLYDCYHMQIMEGNIIANIEKHIDVIGHFHSAGVPGRHELMSGELDYRRITAKIDSLGYKEVFGLEYSPSMASSAESLEATRKYLAEAQ